MLNRVMAWGLMAVLLTGGPVSSAPTAYAQSEGGVVCVERDPATEECILHLTIVLTGNPATVTASMAGSGGGTQVMCDRSPFFEAEEYQLYEHRETACYHEEHGWYSSTYDCYFQKDERILPGDPGVIMPNGYEPGDPGAVYLGMCISAVHPDVPADDYCGYCTPPRWNGPGHYRFLASPPDGFGVQVDPVPELLVSAIEELALEGPTIGTAPPAGEGAGLVRLPVWLWNEVNDNNWGTPDATVGPIAGISVVAQAEAAGIEWDMGDGGSVRCDEGVAWERGMDVFDPPCGYPYPRASRHEAGGAYEISATTTWELEWWTEGLLGQRGGEFQLQATSTTTMEIIEIQVLTGDG